MKQQCSLVLLNLTLTTVLRLSYSLFRNVFINNIMPGISCPISGEGKGIQQQEKTNLNTHVYYQLQLPNYSNLCSIFVLWLIIHSGPDSKRC